MAQAGKLPRVLYRCCCNAAIANDTSPATYANFAHSITTSSNNCAIKLLCGPGNPGNHRRRNKYSLSSRAVKGEWRAANFAGLLLEI